MKLYEASNGFMGFSGVTCKVWANDEAEGKKLAEMAFKEAEEAELHGESYWNNIELILIVDTDIDKEPFYTEPTD